MPNTVKSSDQITIVDLTDAYSVMLSMDSISLNGGVATLGTQQQVTIYVAAFCGAEQKTPTVGSLTCPTGVTASIGSVSNSMVPITFTFAATLADAGAVTIPVSIDDIEIDKKFTFSIAFKGNPGTSVTVSSIKYATSTTETQPADSAFSTTFPSTVAEGNWLWTKVTFSTGDSVVTKSKQGKSGTPGTSYYTHIRYSANSDGSSMSPSPSSSSKYIGIYTGTSQSAPSSASSYTWSQYHGNDGADAITMVLQSSNGTIFKNSSIATVITAHVYKGGEEVTGSALTALGSISWTIDGSPAPSGKVSGTANNTLTITAGDVTNKAIIVAELS